MSSMSQVIIFSKIMDLNNNKIKKAEENIERLGGTIKGKATHFRDSSFSRFPVMFVLLSTFGLVATFYGFEKVLDQIPIFIEHPLYILFTGLIILSLTGTLYKKLN